MDVETFEEDKIPPKLLFDKEEQLDDSFMEKRIWGIINRITG